MEEILDRCRIQTWHHGNTTEILIACSNRDFALLVRGRKEIPQILALDKAKVTLSCDERVTSFDVVGQRIQC